MPLLTRVPIGARLSSDLRLYILTSLGDSLSISAFDFDESLSTLTKIYAFSYGDTLTPLKAFSLQVNFDVSRLYVGG